jgi:chemotaxis protein methyltransferase CheR
MTGRESTEFLQWALPVLGLRWKGYRNVRRQVEKRIARRIGELGLGDVARYREFLTRTPEEWPVLAQLCRVTITRFYRDHGVFHALETEVLPHLTEQASRAGRSEIVAWSAGCAGGEEAYTLALVWHSRIRKDAHDVRLHILGTDIDLEELGRARDGRYPSGALAELPRELRDAGFEASNGSFQVKDELREGVEFRKSDLTGVMPDTTFDLILCRNLAFTYFDDSLRTRVARGLSERLVPGGALIVGKHEAVPEEAGLRRWSHECVYVKNS